MFCATRTLFNDAGQHLLIKFDRDLMAFIIKVSFWNSMSTIKQSFIFFWPIWLWIFWHSSLILPCIIKRGCTLHRTYLGVLLTPSSFATNSRTPKLWDVTVLTMADLQWQMTKSFIFLCGAWRRHRFVIDTPDTKCKNTRETKLQIRCVRQIIKNAKTNKEKTQC